MMAVNLRQRILVVEDEELIRMMLELNLKKAGYEVVSCEDAETMMDIVDQQYFDLILLDIMLPGMAGDEALKELRHKKVMIPVIMVTAKNSIDTKVDTLGMGAEDYISKPFNIKELLARIESVIRRCQGERMVPANRIVTIGAYHVNVPGGTASSREGDVPLSKPELQLLMIFANRPGERISLDELIRKIADGDPGATPERITRYVNRFRRLFEEDADNPQHFVSVSTKEFRFIP